MSSGELQYARDPHRSHIKWAIFWLVVIIACCVSFYQVAAHIRTHSEPVGKMELIVPYTKYLIGEDVSFTLKNGYNGTVYVTNNCPTEPLLVYKLTDGKWVRIHDEANESECSTQDREIAVPPNGEVSGSFAKWKNLFSTVGKYRVVAFVQYYNSLPYADFEIIEKLVATQPASATPSASSAPILGAKKVAQAQTGSTSSGVVNPSQASSPKPSPTPKPSPSPPTPNPNPPSPAPHVAAKYNVSVRYDRTYVPSSLNLIAGDYIVFTYLNPQGGEGPDIFTSFNPNTVAGGGFELQHDFGPVTRYFNTKGTWTFSASGRNGGSGTVTVN